jgi:2-C-methyl-D-erythritol 4-phosphate cytidylyltransferase
MRKSVTGEETDNAPSFKVGAVIVAAGSSERMGGVDKIFAPLLGQPLLVHTVGVFQGCSSIHEIVIVLSGGSLEQGQKLVREKDWSKVTGIYPGGQYRRESVRVGLRALSNCRWVVIHDGARPCLTSDLINNGLERASDSGAAIAAVPAKDTVKVVADGIIRETPDRDCLWLAQTPQVFLFDIIARAYQMMDEKVTDDASLVEALGYKVRVYMGSYENIKVTTPEDLALAEFILKRMGKV